MRLYYRHLSIYQQRKFVNSLENPKCMKYHTDYTRAFWEKRLNFGVEIFYFLSQKPKKCDIYQFSQYFLFYPKLNREKYKMDSIFILSKLVSLTNSLPKELVIILATSKVYEKIQCYVRMTMKKN